jgi:hypothetical protein
VKYWYGVSEDAVGDDMTHVHFVKTREGDDRENVSDFVASQGPFDTWAEAKRAAKADIAGEVRSLRATARIISAMKARFAELDEPYEVKA